MKKNTSRFSYDVPNLLQMIWLFVRYRADFDTHCRAWVTDHRTGEQYQLDEDEEVMMDVLMQSMHAICDDAKVPLTESNRFWHPKMIDAAKDRVLTAISDRRLGNSTEWNRLKVMKPAEWKNWLLDMRSMSN